MPFLLFLLFPVLEIWCLVKFGQRYGVVNTLFALLAMGVLGVSFAKAQGRYLLSRLQSNLSRGEIPTNEVLHGLLVFVGGILFLIPGFISDFIGALFVLPGARHLVVFLLRRQLARKIGSGAFRVFTSGSGGFGVGGFGGRAGPFGGASGPFRSSGGSPFESDFQSEAEFNRVRDVSPRVIDVTPISSQSRKDQSTDSE